MTSLRPRPARELKPALKLTLGVWAFCLAGLSVRLWVWREGFPVWTPPFLSLIALSGISLTGALYLWGARLQGLAASWRWPCVVVGALAATITQSLIDHAVYRTLLRSYGEVIAPRFDLDGVVLNFLIYVWLYGLYAVALELLAATARAAEHQRQAAEALALAQEAQLRTLRAQINPHFLFNTLNTISGMVVTGRTREADAMVVKLAHLLRLSLETERTSLVSLASELGAAEAYLDIESVRFGPSLVEAFDCDPELLTALVPSFILQPLIENAIKYAIAPSEGAAAIRVEARAMGRLLQLRVSDNGSHGAPAAAPGGGIGLDNTRRRLAALYGSDGELVARPTQDGFDAIIRLPLQSDAVTGPLAQQI